MRLPATCSAAPRRCLPARGDLSEPQARRAATRATGGTKAGRSKRIHTTAISLEVHDLAAAAAATPAIAARAGCYGLSRFTVNVEGLRVDRKIHNAPWLCCERRIVVVESARECVRPSPTGRPHRRRCTAAQPLNRPGRVRGRAPPNPSPRRQVESVKSKASIPKRQIQGGTSRAIPRSRTPPSEPRPPPSSHGKGTGPSTSSSYSSGSSRRPTFTGSSRRRGWPR